MTMTLYRAFAGGVAALGLASSAFAETEEVWSTCAAGRELSPGVTVGDTTYGVVFFGWLKEPDPEMGCPFWYPFWHGNGGRLIASVQRQGEAGFGNVAALTPPPPPLKLNDGTEAKACVDSGTVTWPNDPDDELDGCGQGVASVSAELSWGCTGEVSGRFEGCLDDQDWLSSGSNSIFLRPPKVWGEIWADPE